MAKSSQPTYKLYLTSNDETMDETHESFAALVKAAKFCISEDFSSPAPSSVTITVYRDHFTAPNFD